MAKTTRMLDQLAERRQTVAEAQMKVRDIEQQAKHATAEAARLREELVESYANDDEAQAEKLGRAKAKADARAAEPWVERAAGAQRAANRLAAEVDSWRIQNVHQLLEEIAPDAHATASAIEQLVAELEAARQRWHATSQQVGDLVRDVPGVNPRDLPRIDAADAAIRDLRRNLGNVPTPMPPFHHTPAEYTPAELAALQHTQDELERAHAKDPA